MDKKSGLAVPALLEAFRKAMAVGGFVGVISTALVMVAEPGSAQKKSLSMLDQLAHGAWELRGLGSGAGKICLNNGRQLIQLRHPGEACSTVVVEDHPSEVTVQYTCPGRGYGRTHVRRETNALVQIDGQGIVNGQPFAFATEGRRVGACGS